MLTLIPVPKNPHGINVTPDGRYAIASGKLSPTVTIIDAHTLKIVAEPEVGLGPLHTTFDDRGNAFTSLFLDSQVVKWNIDKAVKGASDYIVDRINVHYNIGHLQAVGGDHMHPCRRLSARAEQAVEGSIHSGRSGSAGEPGDHRHLGREDEDARVVPDAAGAARRNVHGGVGAEADGAPDLHARQPMPWRPARSAWFGPGRTRSTVDMTLIRSAYTPDSFQVREGDQVTLKVTNVETIRDMIHGFALPDHNLNIALAPGYTKTITFDAGKPGVYWYYCTNFCSALHLEMRGRMVVQPKDGTVTLTDWHAAENVKGQVVPGVPSTGDRQ